MAVKIRVAEDNDNDKKHGELSVMKKLASRYPHPLHVMHMVDDFDLEGPNGIHHCLVLELLGPSVPDFIDACFPDGRLPGKLAKDIAKQVVSGLDFLHREDIGHGGGFTQFLEEHFKIVLTSIDLHTRNLAFTIQSMDNVPETEFIETLGKPDIGQVHTRDGKALEPGIPEYIVRPAGMHSWPLSNTIKIVDFGESFLQQTVPETLHTPLSVRAPEIIFKDRLDYRVDLWSLGCMVSPNYQTNYRFRSK